METGGEGVLMQKTNVHDVRGRLSLLGRLLEFYREAFVHLLFYRALIISSLITGGLICSEPFILLVGLCMGDNDCN